MTDARKTVALPWDAKLFLFLGIMLEIGAVVQRLYVDNPVLNAFTGLIASLVLFYGAIRFMMTIDVGQQAIYWVIAAGFFYFGFRVVDVMETVYRNIFTELFRADRFVSGDINFDAVLRDIVIVFSAMSLLMGVAQALYHSFKSQQQLIERNAALDREVESHKAAEARTRMSQETLSVLINALSAAVLLIDREGRIVTHNRYFSEMLGDGERDYCGAALNETMDTPLFDPDPDDATVDGPLDDPKVAFKRYNGRTFDVKSHPVVDPQGTVSNIAVLAQDITERLAVERARALLDTAISCAAETVMITDNSGIIEYVNPAFESMTGYSAREACGATPALLRSGQQDADFYRALWDTIKGGDVWRGEIVNRRKNGDLFREHATISPITDEYGVITHFVAVKRDTTRERDLEEQIQQAQKIDMIGTLAGGIAHDFNNVLAIVMGHSELVLNRLEPDNPLRKNLETIMRTAARSSKLTKRLLAFSRRNMDEAHPVSAAAVVREQINVVRVYLPSNILIENHIVEDAGYIHTDPGELQQAVVNLCSNASDAMQPRGGRLFISLEPVEISESRVASTGELTSGDYVCLRVRDTGCGMDAETLSRIFEPFYTTKAVGAGTGLGLAMARGSVLQSGGAIDVSSTLGKGTQFDVYWPAIDYTPVAKETRREPIDGKGRRILIVDDMEDFASLTELNLVNHGFQINAFSEPREALAFFQDNASDIDAVITDYMMPEMNGAEVARALHDLRPDLPVLLMTGYACGITTENAGEHGISLVLHKPTSAERLAQSLIELVPRTSSPSPQDARFDNA